VAASHTGVSEGGLSPGWTPQGTADYRVTGHEETVMGGDNVLNFPALRTSTDARITEITTLAEDISDLLHGEFRHLDLDQLLALIEGTSSKLYEIGTLLVDDSKKERLAINFLSIRKLITEARRRLAATNRNEGR
jgi:hypothetical protein